MRKVLSQLRGAAVWETCTITLAGLQGVYWGIFLWSQQYTNILLETDFSSALHLISQGVPVTHSCSSLAVTIRNLMYVELNVDLMHVFHEGNKCADKLASLGHRFPKSLTSFDRMPSCISLDFLADNTGQGCTRFVFDQFLWALSHVVCQGKKKEKA